MAGLTTRHRLHEDVERIPIDQGMPREEMIAAPSSSMASIRSALGFGLVTGWLELGLVLAQRALDPRISMASLRTNRHFVWMIPVSDVLIFGAVGLLIALIARFRPRIARWLSWRLLVGLTALALLLTIEGLYAIAGVVLAWGVGVLLGPVLERRAPRLRRLSRVGLSVLGAGAVLMTCLVSERVTSAERRALSGRSPAPAGAPNVLFIVLDNVRAASMSLYGHDRPTTPNLERLARDAIRFTNARSPAPWTLPSHASMFTGQWCHRLSVDFDRPLDATYPTLAEYLAGHGYATAGFVGNTYYCNARYGLGRGFDRYEDHCENQAVSLFEVVRSTALGKRALRAIGFAICVEDGASLRKTAEMLNRDVLGWLDGRPRGRPFFVFLNYFDAHGPFVPPDGPAPRFGLGALPNPEQVEILKRYQRLTMHELAPGEGPPDRIEREATDVLRDSYESCIAYLDRQVGRLFDELDRRGLLGNTLVVVTSDHGEHFKEHGFFGHGLSLYRHEVHVPLLILPPSGRRAGRVVAEPVSLRDLAATSVDLLGLADRAPFPGQSLGRFWRSGAAAGSKPAPLLCEVGHQKGLPPSPAIPSTQGPVKSLVAEGRVYIRNGDGREEIYDLLNDPLEAHNLVGEASLRASLGRFRSSLDRLFEESRGRPTEPDAGRDDPVEEVTDE